MVNLCKPWLRWSWVTLHVFVGKEHRWFRKHFRIWRDSRWAEVVLNWGRWEILCWFLGRRFVCFFLIATLLSLIALIVLVTILIVLITVRWAERLDSCHRFVIDVAA